MRQSGRKLIYALTALLLCAALLGGCWISFWLTASDIESLVLEAQALPAPEPQMPGPAQTPEATPAQQQKEPARPPGPTRPTPTHFADMAYVRPDASAIVAQAEALLAKLAIAGDAAALKSEYDAFEAACDGFSGMYALAMIHASMDRSDAYWVEEERVLLELQPAVAKAASDVMRALYASSLRNEIEADWDPDFFTYIEEFAFITEETKPLFEREAALLSEYRDRMATCAVAFEGKQMTYQDIYALEDYAAWERGSKLWYEAYNVEFVERYIEMVKVRNEIARTLGFGNYAEFAFRTERRDYTPDMARMLLADIQKELVPLLRQLQRFGRYRPQCDMAFQDFSEFMQDTLFALDLALSEAFNAMLEYGLYDLEPRAYKEQGAFTMYIRAYELPFILGSYTGDLYSMSMVAHEFGHFYSDFATMKTPGAYVDTAELHSQAMELLVANHFADAFQEQFAYQMCYDTLYNAFVTLAGQVYYTAMELNIYALDENALTVDALNSIAYEACARYGMDNYFEEFARYDWVTLPHIMERPFSTLGYATSVSAAIELWELSLQNEAEALAIYDTLIHRAPGVDFLALLRQAGLKSPFDADRIGELYAWAEKYLLDEDWS